MAEILRRRSLLPLVRAPAREHAAHMMMISCPTTRTRVLVSLDAIRSITNHADAIAGQVTCPACGEVHVHRTGRRLEEARRTAALEVAVRRAQTQASA